MTASTQGQVATEIMRDAVVSSGHLVGGDGDLMWPLSVNSAGLKLAFTPAHGAP
jgi:hypothetical protein